MRHETCSVGQQICREQPSTSEALQWHHFEHLILYDSHPENITLWTPPHWGFSHVRRSLAVLTQSFKQDIPLQMGIESPHMFTEKSPQWDSYLLINKWFMWSTPNKICTKDVRTVLLTSQPRISERLWECTTTPKAFCSRNLIAQSTDLFLWVLQHNDSVWTRN